LTSRILFITKTGGELVAKTYKEKGTHLVNMGP